MDRVINAGLILCLSRTSFDSGPDCAKWVKAGHKPGSVHASTEVGLQRVGGYLSGTAVTDGLERRIQAERDRWPALVPRPCSQPGFT